MLATQVEAAVWARGGVLIAVGVVLAAIAVRRRSAREEREEREEDEGLVDAVTR